MEKRTSSTLLKALVCAALTLGAATMAQAQAVDPSGTWIWTNPGRNGATGSTNTLVLKYANSTLTGSLKTPARGGKFTTTDITDGTLTGAKISFDVTRTYGTNSMKIEYSGTVATDTITGTSSTTSRSGNKRSRKWEAKRESAGSQ